jgi:hypothetical protein
VNPTYEMCRAGSEHGDKPQRQSLTNQLPFLHGETQSHHPTKSISLLGFRSGPEMIRNTGLRHQPPRQGYGCSRVIEEAPEPAKDRRERWWRNTKIRAVFRTESWVTLTRRGSDSWDRLDGRWWRRTSGASAYGDRGRFRLSGPGNPWRSDSSCEV